MLKNVEFILIASLLRGRTMSTPSFSLESCVLSLWSGSSTSVENIRQIRLFLQNKPNFRPFPTKNEDYAKKQTQYKANSNPIKANFGPKMRVSKLKQTQSNPFFKDYVYRKLYEKSPNLGIYALSIRPSWSYNVMIIRNNFIKEKVEECLTK